MHSHICAHTHTLTHMHRHTLTHTCTHTHTHIHTLTHTYTHTHTYTLTHTCTDTLTHIYTHSHTYTLTHRHTHTLGRAFLDEWSVRRKDRYMSTHNTHKRQTSMHPAVFEPIIPASERPQTHALDSGATGNDLKRILLSEISSENFYYSWFSVINYRLLFTFHL